MTSGATRALRVALAQVDCVLGDLEENAAAHVVFVNRVGTEAGMTFWGGSQALDPRGAVIAEAPRGEAAVTVAELDLDAVRRRRREMPLIKEARLGLLGRELERLDDAAS